MNVQEKMIARKLFQNKVYKSDGQAFEDIFTEVMNYSERDFQSIKPWGNIGDRKNDGYIRSKGIFYQVYAPENIHKSYPDAVKKIKTDFEGLLRQWSPINEFYFVVNDKYKGVNADSEMAIQKIKSTYNLKEAAILTAKDIENMVFKLEDDQILSITGSIPDPKTKNLDYTVLNEVIEHIMLLPLNAKSNYKITLPNWEDKIKFNNLSSETAGLLNSGYTHIQSLEEYLSNNGNFLADALRDQINDIYCQERNKNHGDDLFWAIVERLSPKSQSMYQITVIIIMSKYFETCDIFEEPLKEGEK